MTEASARTPDTVAPFDMKAGQFTIPTLVLRDRDAGGLDRFLAEQVARSPGFFDRAPVAIDVSQLPGEEFVGDLAIMVGILRGHGMIPVGVRGAAPEQHEQILALELALMPAARRPAQTKPQPVRAAQPTSHSNTLVIEEPVRSGQRVFARGGDLVLLAGVGSGAEVMADGHIHAYGALRGRAMAGVSGNVTSRIFCRELRAELISIAGRYRVSENLEGRYIGRGVQVSLSGDSLDFVLL